MSEQSAKRSIGPQPLYAPEIGRWLWALQDGRQRTTAALEGCQTAVLDWLDPLSCLTIGSLLYHIAAIEMSWLYENILAQDFPPDIESLFPWPVRENQGELTMVLGVPLSKHIRRMDMARSYFLGAFVGMDEGEFQRPRGSGAEAVSPAWVVHHLIQHEAEHRGQIMRLRQRAEGS